MVFDDVMSERFTEISFKHGMDPTILNAVLEARNCGNNNTNTRSADGRNFSKIAFFY